MANGKQRGTKRQVPLYLHYWQPILTQSA
jgi:hypothetical protein